MFIRLLLRQLNITTHDVGGAACRAPIGRSKRRPYRLVMNAQAELHIAFEEYEKGTFIKHK